MARVAVIDEATGKVLNTIMADPEKDPAPEGSKLVALGMAPIDSDWSMTPGGDFVKVITSEDLKAYVDQEKLDEAQPVEAANVEAPNPG